MRIPLTLFLALLACGPAAAPEEKPSSLQAALEGARPLQHNGYKLALLETAARRALMGAT